ncbi:MAG: hypothetical protein AB7G37_21580 [Solirubrobacteraceae bacterium]
MSDETVTRADPTETSAGLPRTVEELTPEWLTAALAVRRPGVRVREATIDRVISGSATKAFLTLRFEGDPQGVPEQVCVKGGFDERSRAFGLAQAYEIEGAFYRDLAPELDVRLPACYFAEVEPGQGIVLLEDLTTSGATFGDVDALWPVDRVAEALEVQAGWHAALWGTPATRFPWLKIGCIAARDALHVMLGPEQFQPLVTRPGMPDVSAPLRDEAHVRRAFRALWEHDDAAEHTVNHGDAHFAQTYLLPEDGPAFLDWQAPCLAPWSHDVTYFLGSALTVEDRRRHERSLLAHYLEALAGLGGPRIPFDDAWTDYRRHTLHGFAWMVVPDVMQPIEVVRSMATRYAAAIEDHDPFSLLLA